MRWRAIPSISLALLTTCSGDPSKLVVGSDAGPARVHDAAPEVHDAAPEMDGAHDAARDAQRDSPESPAPDATPDAATDAPMPPCDPSAPFRTPVLLPGPNINTTSEEGGPRLSADELTLYFSRNNGNGNASDLFVAHRAHATDAFDPPTVLANVNSTSYEFDPTASVTQLTLFFTSDRLGNQDLYVATRASVTSDFGIPTDLPAPLNSSSNDAQPFLRADGSELWFSSDRPGGEGYNDIYRAAKVGSSFGAPERVAELASPQYDYCPTLSEDGLVIFFASNRAATEDAEPAGAARIWSASRTHPSDPFGELQIESTLNSSGSSADYPGWLSADGCRLYMSSNDRPGGIGSEDIYLATRGGAP
jgi:Tol biopolymer transport system component